MSTQALEAKKGRARSIRLGLEHGAMIALLDLIFAHTISLDHPIRAPAVGASLATLAMIIGGLLLGVRVRRQGGGAITGWRERRGVVEMGPKRSTPFLAVAVSALFLAGFGALLLYVPAAAEALLGAPAVAPSMAHAIVAADSIVLPGLALITVGAALGTYAHAGWLSGSIGGLVLLLGLQIGGGLLAPQISWDPAVINVAILSTTLVSFLITGAAVTLWVRRLGFVELLLVALGFGYALYVFVGIRGGALLVSATIPEQQLLVALSLIPTALAICLLTVGASGGFLLFGGGAVDSSFGFELPVAIRYLKPPERPLLMIGIVIAVVMAPLVLALTAAALPIWGIIRLTSRARRSVQKKPRGTGFVGVTLVISVMGVCLGVEALIVVLSVMSGFEDDLKTKILGAHAHVAITKKGDDFTEYEDLEAKVEKIDGVDSAASFVLGEGMISSEAGLSGTLVKGIDPNDTNATHDLKKDIEQGELDALLDPSKIPGSRRSIRLPASSTTSTSSDALKFNDFAEPIVTEGTFGSPRVLPGIVVGREMAKTLRVYVGDVVNLVSPVSEEIGPTGPQPKLRRFRVAAIFYSGMYEFDSKFTYIEMKQAQRFFGLRKKATGIELRVGDLDDTSRIVEEVKRRVGGHPYAVKDWREMNKELFSALLLEKLAMFIILTFIVMVASFLIVSTLVMIVLEKGREIAILKSMGASDASIMKIFVIQGVVVGLLGAVSGLIGGVGICLLIQRFGIDLDPDIFYITRLPVVMSANEIAVIVVSATLITFLASVYPAMAAAQLSPVEGLRNE